MQCKSSVGVNPALYYRFYRCVDYHRAIHYSTPLASADAIQQSIVGGIIERVKYRPIMPHTCSLGARAGVVIMRAKEIFEQLAEVDE